MQDGSGLGKHLPSLTKLDFSEDKLKTVVCVVRNGIKREDTSHKQLEMPANKDLTHTEIANILNYMLHSWSEQASPVKELTVAEYMDHCN